MKPSQIRAFLFSAILIFSLFTVNPVFAEKLLIEAGIGITQFDENPAATLSASAGTRMFGWLDGGLTFTAFHTLERNYSDEKGRTFQAESGFAALYLRPFFAVSERLEIGFPLQSGTGTLLFRYEEKYRKSLTWTEEIIDQVTYSVYSAGVDAHFELCEKHSLVFSGAYENTIGR